MATMHLQNAMLEIAPKLHSPRPRTGEPNATFGCTEASTPAWPCFHVHPIHASVGPSPNEATTATWRYQSNQQYSITAVTTSSGSVAERYTYTGREWDATLELYHFRARWMTGLAGRLMGRDPIGFEGSEWGLYEFIDNRPLEDLDPLGLSDSVSRCLLRPTVDSQIACLEILLATGVGDAVKIRVLLRTLKPKPAPVPVPIPRTPASPPSPQPPVVFPNDPIQAGPIIVVVVIREVLKCLENQRPPNPPYPPITDPNEDCVFSGFSPDEYGGYTCISGFMFRMRPRVHSDTACNPTAKPKDAGEQQ